MPSHRRPLREPIEVLFDHVFQSGGLDPSDVQGLASRLENVRNEVLDDAELWASSGAEIPESKRPLDAAFIDLPQRMLDDYRTDREAATLGRIFAVARRLSEQVDRVVLLGIGGSYMGARALFESCCPPHFNELSRAERGGRPRLSFAGNNVDNDATRGLLDLLPQGAPPADLADDWAIVVVSKSGGTLETAVAFRVFLRALASRGFDREALAQRIVPVTGRSGKLAALADELGCPDRFEVPDGVGGRFSVFSAVGLLPAAILGLDVVSLLEGACEMTERFIDEPFENNPVLRYVATAHASETLHGQHIRVQNFWSDALEAVGLWYDQLLAESLGKAGQGATPITTVNTRDLHSRAQQHQEGPGDKFHTHVYVERPRTDPLAIGTIHSDADQLDWLSQRTFPELLDAAFRGTLQAYEEMGRPGVLIRLPQIHEYTIGQLLQFWMLATVVEGYLIGVHPYGQPGVEYYKRHMFEILESSKCKSSK